MGIKTKASVQSTFETGDIPTEAQFADFIDSSVFIPADGATGMIEVESTASSTSRAVGAFGVQMLAADTTAAANDLLAIAAATSVAHSTFGIAWVSAASTAAAQEIIGQPTFSAFGRAVASAATTAAGQLVLGGGTVGIQVYESATTAAAVAALGSPGGAWETISTTTASDDGTVDITGFDNSKYASYKILFQDVTPATGNALPDCRTSTNGGSSFDTSGYAWVATTTDEDSTTAVAGSAGEAVTDRIRMCGAGLSTATVGYSGFLEIYEPGNATDCQLVYHVTVNQDTTEDCIVSYGGGKRDTAADVDAIQFFFSTGNVESGDFVFLGQLR